MYIVKVYAGRSPVEGIGVFAGEDIPEGAVVWRFVPGFDQGIELADIPGYPPAVQSYLRRHAYLNKGKMWLCGDLGMYTNHSDTPNVLSIPNDRDIALRPIRKGEEITANYAAFDEESRDVIDLPLP